MYIESKSEGLEGPAGIGRVYFSKSGKTLHYQGLRFQRLKGAGFKFQRLKGAGFKANYVEITSGDPFWISEPRKDRQDRLYGGQLGVMVDSDVREEYDAFCA
ncbi:MAG: 1-deoxy-D-xylulose-5-phosphate synthase [Paracoccaceae bacterium]